MKRNVKKVMLAYSGGLDTSIIIPWLKENYDDVEVIGFCGDVGQGDDFDAVRKKALATGASKCIVKDLRDEFVRDYCYKALAAGAIYEGSYLLGTSLARPCIGRGLMEAADAEGADAIAHGATGKGNDQVRFELTAYHFRPGIRVIAPWREWEFKGRRELIEYTKTHKTVDGFPGSEPFANDDLWGLDVDVLIPAALENQITLDNAPQIKARIVIEGANGPTTPAAHRHMHERGIFVVPDILANSGGVTVSYFEWVQDRYGYFWELDDVNSRLEKKMRESFDDVLQTSLKYKVDMRIAAYIVAISRVGTVTKLRGMYA